MTSMAEVKESLEENSSSFWTTPADDGFRFSNLKANHMSVLKESGPFVAIVLSYWDNVLGPRLQHVWRGAGDTESQESSVKYVVGRTLHGELLRDAPENMVDTKLFVLKDHNIVCHSFIFSGCDKSGANISGLSLIVPFSEYKSYLPFIELVEERVKILIAKLRVLQAKDLSSAMSAFSVNLPRFIQTITSLKTTGVPESIPLSETAFGPGQADIFDDRFLRRVITSHLQTFGSTLIIGKALDKVNLMVNTLALLLPSEERKRSRFAVETLSNDSDLYDSDLFVQGLLKSSNDSFSLPVKGIITSSLPSTLVDMDTGEVKQTCPFNEHIVIRREFIDIELALLLEEAEDAPVFPELGLFHNSEEIGILVQTFMHDLNLLPYVCGVREGFINNFLRLLDRKALALIKYLEAKSSFGTVPLDYVAKRQLRQDLQLGTEADYSIVLTRAEKLHPGIYTFLKGDPCQNVDRVQALFESL
ncbi:hypothetical protein ACROYT_G043911 [Oculina patagonica]